MKRFSMAASTLFALALVVANCTTPVLKEAPREAAIAEADTGCATCHSPGEVAAGDALTMHAIHFSALGEEIACDACHTTDGEGNFRVIHSESGAVIAFSLQQATTMHPFYLSWSASGHLDDRHRQHRVDCSGCHGSWFPAAGPSMESCLQCHGSYARVAQLTQAMAFNPHDSHVGEIDCAACHKGHDKFELYCNECHEFELDGDGEQ